MLHDTLISATTLGYDSRAAYFEGQISLKLINKQFKDGQMESPVRRVAPARRAPLSGADRGRAVARRPPPFTRFPV